MAVTQIAFGFVNGVTPTGGSVLALQADMVTQEVITPGGSNLATTAVAGSYPASPIARVATDTAIYVSFGASPNASSDATRLYIPAGGVEYVAVRKGDKAAVIAA